MTRWQYRSARIVSADLPAIDLPAGAIPSGPPKHVASRHNGPMDSWVIYWWQPYERRTDA